MQELIDFFKEIDMYYIATIEDDKPRVRPFGKIFFYNNRMFINTGKNKRFFSQVKNNSNVELCAFNKGTWIRIEASVFENFDSDIKKSIIKIDPVVKHNYKDNQDILAIFELKNIKAYRCKFNGCELIYESK